MDDTPKLCGLSPPKFLRRFIGAKWAPGEVPGKGGGGTTDIPTKVQTALDGNDAMERAPMAIQNHTTDASMLRVFVSPGLLWANRIAWFLSAAGFHPTDVEQAINSTRAVLAYNPASASAMGRMMLGCLGMDAESLALPDWRSPKPGGGTPFDVLRGVWKALLLASPPPISRGEVTVDGRSRFDAGADSGWLTDLFDTPSQKSAAAQMWITICQRCVFQSMEAACGMMVGITTGSTCRVHGSSEGVRNPAGFVADFLQAAADPTTRGVVGVFTMAPTAVQSLEPGSLSWLETNIHCVDPDIDSTTVMIVLVMVWLPEKGVFKVMCAPYSLAMSCGGSETSGIPPLREAPAPIRAVVPLVLTHFATPAVFDSRISRFVAIDYESHAGTPRAATDDDDDDDEDEDDDVEDMPRRTPPDKDHDIRTFFETRPHAGVVLKPSRKPPPTPKTQTKLTRTLKRGSGSGSGSGGGSGSGSDDDGSDGVLPLTTKKRRVIDDDDDDDE